jgi:type IV secretory pathway VirB2 component (pilin)
MKSIRSILRGALADVLAVFAFVAVLAMLWWGPK